MEPYRHALYRYSTGQGFSVNVDVPHKASEVASFKMKPLLFNLVNAEKIVDLRREADRVSMQLEDGMRQIKNLGYNADLAKNLKVIKDQVELISHLLTNYPIRHIKRDDLEDLYSLFTKNGSGMDTIINKVIQYNRGAGGIDAYIDTAKKVRKGYPLFDQFGRRLTKDQSKEFRKEEKAEPKSLLSGLGDALPESTSSKLIIAAIVIIVLRALLK